MAKLMNERPLLVRVRPRPLRTEHNNNMSVLRATQGYRLIREAKR